MITSIKKIISEVQKNNSAVGAFNVYNLESTLAVVRAAVKKNSPVIIQVTQSSIKYAGLKNIFNIIKTAAENEGKDVPIAIHLDHGKDLKLVKKCVKLGFSSVHYDGSELSYLKNLKNTQKAVKFAHKRGVWVQGELGTIIGSKSRLQGKISSNLEQYMTKPEQALDYVKQTGIDTFAPSVGAMHGMFKGEEKLNLELIKNLSEKTKLPLVLHGASGVPNSDIKSAIKNGVRVINIDTRLRKEFTETLKDTLKKNKKEIDPRKILLPEIDAMQKAAEEKIDLFGSSN